MPCCLPILWRLSDMASEQIPERRAWGPTGETWAQSGHLHGNDTPKENPPVNAERRIAKPTARPSGLC
jgi:hypothetical protein